jgi:hypothetical protein
MHKPNTSSTKRAQFTERSVGAGAARAAVQFAQREISRAVTLPAGTSPGAFEAKLGVALTWIDKVEAREAAMYELLERIAEARSGGPGLLDRLHALIDEAAALTSRIEGGES